MIFGLPSLQTTWSLKIVSVHTNFRVFSGAWPDDLTSVLKPRMVDSGIPVSNLEGDSWQNQCELLTKPSNTFLATQSHEHPTRLRRFGASVLNNIAI